MEGSNPPGGSRPSTPETMRKRSDSEASSDSTSSRSSIKSKLKKIPSVLLRVAMFRRGSRSSASPSSSPSPSPVIKERAIKVYEFRQVTIDEIRQKLGSLTADNLPDFIAWLTESRKECLSPLTEHEHLAFLAGYFEQLESLVATEEGKEEEKNKQKIAETNSKLKSDTRFC